MEIPNLLSFKMKTPQIHQIKNNLFIHIYKTLVRICERRLNFTLLHLLVTFKNFRMIEDGERKIIELFWDNRSFKKFDV